MHCKGCNKILSNWNMQQQFSELFPKIFVWSITNEEKSFAVYWEFLN